MVEILPIRLVTDEDALIFGKESVALGKLSRVGIPVAPGIVITAPFLKLKTVLEHFDFSSKEVLNESLTLIWKEISKIPVPQILIQETGKHKHFLLNGIQIKSVKGLWFELLRLWLEQIKQRFWDKGFYQGITENLETKIITFVNKIASYGSAFEDTIQDDVVVNIKYGKVHPNDLKKITEIVKLANKKLFLPYEYEWIVDEGVKLVTIKPYTSNNAILGSEVRATPESNKKDSGLTSFARMTESKKSAVKVFFDLSTGFTIEKEVDGIYINSENIFDLNKPRDSFEKLVFKIVESAVTFPNSQILVKLADQSEGMGKMRGALRLLHQKSLLDPMIDALDFARHKKGLLNVHLVIPCVRSVNELMQIKRELAVKKLMRKNSLKILMEIAIPENIINLENYLLGGIDGVVLNLDELVAHLNGFDPREESLAFYKNEVDGLLKFLEDGVKLLHKSKIPFIAYGSLSFYPKVLEFLVEKGVYGIVAERYEAHSAHELLRQIEKRVLLRRS